MVKFIKACIYDWRVKRACKKADKYAKTTGYKVLVLLIDGKPIVKYRKVLKEEIKRKNWKCSLEMLEKRALYKTY
ncbi:MAG: hypothetical protein FWC34_11065 [Bacteroidetes bacterium]|nr:hypothetical protein [Bacteroidota bacterium]MCL2302918.1 hypothetical protein [Lentimicrobiaceae bacterium]